LSGSLYNSLKEIRNLIKREEDLLKCKMSDAAQA
jgi:hypothetical protein